MIFVIRNSQQDKTSAHWVQWSKLFLELEGPTIGPNTLALNKPMFALPLPNVLGHNNVCGCYLVHFSSSPSSCQLYLHNANRVALDNLR